MLSVNVRHDCDCRLKQQKAAIALIRLGYKEIALAKLTGTPVLPVAFGAESKSALNSWDKTLLPRPFTRIAIVFGKPIEVERRAGADRLEEKRLELEKELNRITDLADTTF